MPAPPTHYGRDVTGNARFRRSSMGGKLILEVEIRNRCDDALGGDTFTWIDASEGDLCALRYQRKHKKLEPLL